MKRQFIYILLLCFQFLFYFSQNKIKISFDYKSLKKNLDLSETSSTLSNKKIENFKKEKNTKYFFGAYYFIDLKIPKQGVVYTLVVCDSIKTWKNNNKSEKFIELTSTGSIIKLNEKISVNETKDNLLKIFGKPLKIKNEYYIYKIDIYFRVFI